VIPSSKAEELVTALMIGADPKLICCEAVATVHAIPPTGLQTPMTGSCPVFVMVVDELGVIVRTIVDELSTTHVKGCEKSIAAGGDVTSPTLVCCVVGVPCTNPVPVSVRT
jgi:hypothetical protein